tara:strand:+ start:93 stop:377 length:285 start_codon:yes stop_codon:yes gene_type:complete
MNNIIWNLLQSGSKNGWEFIVRGKGAFPLDMLRYDKCYPLDGSFSGVFRNGRTDTLIDVRLRSDKDRLLTPDRWNSFGWGIVEAYKLNKYGQRK